jgi:ATP-dependent Clp protease adaptor protein ClpS
MMLPCTETGFLVDFKIFENVHRPMSATPGSNPLEQEQQDDEVALGEPAKVILFNDEIHTFDEVIHQLIKATGCSREKAEALAWEVHSRGKAMVFTGELHRCMEVSSILEEIQLMTQIEV